MLRSTLPLACFLALACTGCFIAPNETILGRVDGSVTPSDPDAGPFDGGGDAGARLDAGGPIDAGEVPLTDGGICSLGGWCWVHPTPVGAAFNAAAVMGPNDVWAVGNAGATARYANGQWLAQPPVTDFNIEEVEVNAGRELWAIAKEPAFSEGAYELLRFDGTRWSKIPHGTLDVISDVVGSPSGEVWLHTSARTTTIAPRLQRWNGSSFVPAPALPAGLTPRSICVRSPTEVWASVAVQPGSNANALYRWDGGLWIEVYRTTGSTRIDSALACPADDVVVMELFEFDTASSWLLEVRNGRPRPLVSFPSSWDLVRTPHGDAFIVQGRSVSQWTPTGLVMKFDLAPQQSIYSTRFDFLGAFAALADGKPTVSILDGTSFRPVDQLRGGLTSFVFPGPGQDPSAIFGDGEWAVRTGASWTFRQTPMTGGGTRLAVQRAQQLPNGDAWLVAENGLAKYVAATQTVAMIPSPDAGTVLDGLTGAVPDALWVLGGDRLIMRFDGQRWSQPPVAPPTMVNSVRLTTLTLTDFDVRSENDIMVLGNDPAGGRFLSIFFTWNGSAWTATATAGESIGLFERDPDGNVYILEGATVRKRTPTGTTWTDVARSRAPPSASRCDRRPTSRSSPARIRSSACTGSSGARSSCRPARSASPALATSCVVGCSTVSRPIGAPVKTERSFGTRASRESS